MDSIPHLFNSFAKIGPIRLSSYFDAVAEFVAIAVIFVVAIIVAVAAFQEVSLLGDSFRSELKCKFFSHFLP